VKNSNAMWPSEAPPLRSFARTGFARIDFPPTTPRASYRQASVLTILGGRTGTVC